ncbi:RHS repeat-associated core domain-containing protein [Streptomyces sp. B-S-A8]|uniref:RHS repeat-associated core domain-containing protein n=1 Tax=Streptomyces solicavernae TaxID=3043614 RepID=A0ABT6RUS2_9ACTN|nr:RHS repeat-associated core domain-containing protein [Streptomyces sp. B-S-A8]MDI3388186.1 RHS repeat-associated core domain-containing protein [Streptomyces sp. B-S-A8]
MGRLTKQEIFNPSDQMVQNRSYTYRPDGNLIDIDDQLNGSRRFDLDVAGRVTAVHAADWSETYAYDEAGNQTEAFWPSVMPGQEAVGSRAYAGTRIRTAGAVRYEHDTAGRTVMRQKPRLSRKPDTWRYMWDAEDRLTSVITPDGTTWRYSYDALGRRVSKQRLAPNGETVAEQVDFVWDGTTLCEQMSHTPGRPESVALTWDYEGRRPLAQTERKQLSGREVDDRFYAIVTDLVGTPTELLDVSGEIAWRARGTLWGTTAWNKGATGYTPLRFPGQYFDPETGMHYNYFRHYAPEAARYLSPDPLGLGPAPNPNAYVNSPQTWSDPLGLAPYNIHASVAYQDWGNKGAHIHINKNEVRIFPDGEGGIGAEPIRLKHGTASDREVQKVLDEIYSNQTLREDIIKKATSARDSMNNGEFGMTSNRAAEMHFIIKNLEKLNR